MAFTTSFMGLTAWDLGTDPYDHSQLANNFVAIDLHDHSSGKGKQIGASGISDGAITTAKIQDGAVTAAKILDGAITQAKLANNSVGSAQIIDGSITGADILDGTISNAELDPSVNPIGTIKMWFRVDPSVPVPTGWEVCDGRAWNTVTNKMGPGATQWNTGNMPNFANKFPLGAALSGTGSGATQPPDIGQTGGSMTIDLSHTHTVNAHSHTVNAHSHTIPTQAPHKHLFKTTVWDANNNPIGTATVDGHQRQTALPTGPAAVRQSFYVPDLNRYGNVDDVIAPMAEESYTDGAGNVLGSQPAHNHSGATGTATSTTSSDTATTATSLGTTIDHRNAFVGVLFIIRVI